MAVFMLLCLIFAGCYSWGMRGTVIGGEKGALLPGAFIGMIAALFSGIPIIRESYLLFASLGAVGMYFGGSMTYGETLGLSMDSLPAKNLKRGLVGVTWKGFLWFGVFAALFGTGTEIVCSRFTLRELVLLLILLPLCAVIFHLVFNYPLHPENGIFPKLYFSETRRESWGALLGMLVLLVGVAVAKGNRFTLILTLSSAIGGAVGWLVGQLLQIYCRHHAASSTHAFLRRLSGSRTDAWKVMECTLGALGALGFGIGFLVAHEELSLLAYSLEMYGPFVPLKGMGTDIAMYVWLVLLAGDMVHYAVKKPVLLAELKKKLKTKEISRAEFRDASKTACKEMPKRYERYEWLTEAAEPLLYAGFPFVLLCFGQVNTPFLCAVFLLYWVLMQEVCYEPEKVPVNRKPFAAAAGVVAVALIALQLLLSFPVAPLYTLLLYTLGYEGVTLIWLFSKRSVHRCAPAERSLRELVRESAAVPVQIVFGISIILSILLLMPVL